MEKGARMKRRPLRRQSNTMGEGAPSTFAGHSMLCPYESEPNGKGEATGTQKRGKAAITRSALEPRGIRRVIAAG